MATVSHLLLLLVLLTVPLSFMVTGCVSFVDYEMCTDCLLYVCAMLC